MQKCWQWEQVCTKKKSKIKSGFFKDYPLVTDYMLACFNILCVTNKLELQIFHPGPDLKLS